MGQGGILSEKFSTTPFDQKGTMVLTGKDQSGTRALENTHLIKANADGSYTLLRMLIRLIFTILLRTMQEM